MFLRSQDHKFPVFSWSTEENKFYFVFTFYIFIIAMFIINKNTIQNFGHSVSVWDFAEQHYLVILDLKHFDVLDPSCFLLDSKNKNTNILFLDPTW